MKRLYCQKKLHSALSIRYNCNNCSTIFDTHNSQLVQLWMYYPSFMNVECCIHLDFTTKCSDVISNGCKFKINYLPEITPQNISDYSKKIFKLKAFS